AARADGGRDRPSASAARARPGARAGRSRAAGSARPLLTRQVVTASPEETESLGARLAESLRPGDVVAVAGTRGTGKAALVRGGRRALGVEEPVASPTYAIGHRYEGRVPVAHLDLYRLAEPSAGEWGDLEPYFDGTIAFVEWPEHAGGWIES